MVKNVLIIILIVLAAGEGFLLFRQQSVAQVSAVNSSVRNNLMPPAGPNAKGRAKPIILSKGMNLKTTPLFKYAYQIAPGDLSTTSEKMLTGWTITTKKQSDGSITVALTPKDSQDQSQLYTVKYGETLYFIEQTSVDDKSNQDKDLNYRDDYGLIVDQTGVIQ